MKANRSKQQVLDEYQTAMIAHPHQLHVSSCSWVDHIKGSKSKQQVIGK